MVLIQSEHFKEAKKKLYLAMQIVESVSDTEVYDTIWDSVLSELKQIDNLLHPATDDR